MPPPCTSAAHACSSRHAAGSCAVSCVLDSARRVECAPVDAGAGVLWGTLAGTAGMLFDVCSSLQRAIWYLSEVPPLQICDRAFLCCRGWCELCCGRGCGFCVGPLRRYQEAFSAGRYIPTLQVSNYMNHEAIVQVHSPGLVTLQCLLLRNVCMPHPELGLLMLSGQAECLINNIRLTSTACVTSQQLSQQLLIAVKPALIASAIAVQITDIPEEDIVFVRFEADVSAKPCLPYFIALDRQTSTVGMWQVSACSCSLPQQVRLNWPCMQSRSSGTRIWGAGVHIRGRVMQLAGHT